MLIDHRDIFESVFAETNDAVIVVGLDYKVIVHNKSAEALYSEINGATLFEGFDLSENFYPLNTDIFYDKFSKVFDGTALEFELFSEGFRTAKCFFHRMLPLKSKDIVHSVLWIIKDIDATKRLDEKLRESEKKFKSIVEAAPTAILIVDSQKRIVEGNREADTLFGYGELGLMGKTIDDLIPARFKENHDKYHFAYLKTPTPYRMGLGRKTPAIKSNGQEIIVEISLNTFFIGSEQFAVALIQDITKLVEQERKIQAYIKKLEQIAWNQSHGIRRPLTNIMGIIELIKLEPENIAEDIQHLDIAAKELDKIIHENVYLSQPNSGKME